MSGFDPMGMRLRPDEREDREYLWWLHRETMRGYVDKTWGWDEAWQRGKFDQNFDPQSLRIIEKDSERLDTSPFVGPAMRLSWRRSKSLRNSRIKVWLLK